MSKILKQDKFILSDIKSNSNKYWNISLYEDNTVVTEYGRVGLSGQKSDFPSAGQGFYDKKIKEKTKKGYSPLRTIDCGAVVAPTTELHSIVREQLAKNKPELTSIILLVIQIFPIVRLLVCSLHPSVL